MGLPDSVDRLLVQGGSFFKLAGQSVTATLLTYHRNWLASVGPGGPLTPGEPTRIGDRARLLGPVSRLLAEPRWGVHAAANTL